MKPLAVTGIDHIVLCVADVAATRDFYGRVLGMTAREERPGKFSLHFGTHKISLQNVETAPAIARDTVPGSGNFCVLSDIPLDAWRAHLGRQGVDIVIEEGRRDGAIGSILSLYFRDPDGNVVEVANMVDPR